MSWIFSSDPEFSDDTSWVKDRFSYESGSHIILHYGSGNLILVLYISIGDSDVLNIANIIRSMYFVVDFNYSHFLKERTFFHFAEF